MLPVHGHRLVRRRIGAGSRLTAQTAGLGGGARPRGAAETPTRGSPPGPDSRHGVADGVAALHSGPVSTSTRPQKTPNMYSP